MHSGGEPQLHSTAGVTPNSAEFPPRAVSQLYASVRSRLREEQESEVLVDLDPRRAGDRLPVTTISYANRRPKASPQPMWPNVTRPQYEQDRKRADTDLSYRPLLPDVAAMWGGCLVSAGRRGARAVEAGAGVVRTENVAAPL